jgi:hypothetical protein
VSAIVAITFFRKQQAHLQRLSEDYRESMKTDKSSTLMQLYFSLADARNEFDWAVSEMFSAVTFGGRERINETWQRASDVSYDLRLAYGEPS